MVFSSPLFLFGFLPLLLALLAVCPRGARNGLLLGASLLFYAWGEPVFVALLIGSSVFNYAWALLLERRPGRAWVLGLGVALNLAALGIFKYVPFLAGFVGLGEAAWLASWPAMPIGISFFTFQALSYLVDVSRGDCPAQRGPVKFGLYLAMFPQLIAGPIVRYSEIRDRLDRRPLDLEGFAWGARRFATGLAKKVLIADSVGVAADGIFGAEDGLSFGYAWLGAACYAVQILFDFSGYSDMAIGLGRMCGFRYPENFDKPYAARSVREFWRRWHMTLSRWFRDYLYIPLGGGRGGRARVAFNLLAVFVLCGLWHGASLNFLVWGLYHGLFLALERTAWGGWLDRRPAWLGSVYTLAVVLIGWVAFRAETLADAARYWGAMAGLGGEGRPIGIGRDAWVALLAGAALASGWPQVWLGRWTASWRPWAREGLGLASAYGLLAVAALAVAGGSYSPFLYFRF